MVGLIQEPVGSELPDDYDFSHKETSVSLTEDPWKGLDQGHIVHSRICNAGRPWKLYSHNSGSWWDAN